jgi:hypothetical protein
MWNMYRECSVLHFVQQLLTQHDTASAVLTTCSSQWLNIWRKLAKCWKIWIHMGKYGPAAQYGSCQHHLPEQYVKVWCLKSSTLSSGRRRRIQNHLHSCNPTFPIRNLNNVVLPNMTQSLSPTSVLYQGLPYYITQENIINFFCIS